MDAAREVPAARYMDWAFDALAGVIRFDKACWGIGTHVPPTTHAVHLRGLPPALLLAYEAGIAPIDFTRQAAAARPGRTINDDDVRGDFPDVMPRIKQSICIPFGIANSLATSLAQGGGSPLHHLIIIWRSAEADLFNEDERQLMERCAPHMLSGLRTAQALQLARAGRDERVGAALVDATGTLHSFDDQFIRLVRAAVPDWSSPVLPDALMPVLAGGAAPDGLAATLRPLGPLLAMTLTGRETLHLPPGQQQIAALYAAGMTYGAIAAQLGLAPATVRNQLQRIFRRLGVRSKVALAARLRGQ